MKKRKFVVRVIWLIQEDRLIAHDCVPLILEQLRYAGVVKMHTESEEVMINKSRYNKIVFDVYAPKDVDSESWAKMNAERMRSFGINAVCAPEWHGEMIP